MSSSSRPARSPRAGVGVPAGPVGGHEGDLQEKRKQRLLTVLSGIDKRIAQNVLLRPGALSPPHESVDPQTDSAIRVQCWWRRIRSLRDYRQRLLEHFLEEDRRYWAKQEQVVAETLELLDSLRLQQEKQDRRYIEDANRRLRQRSAYRIQKWFRRSSSDSGESRNRATNKSYSHRRNTTGSSSILAPSAHAQQQPQQQRRHHALSPYRALTIEVGEDEEGAGKAGKRRGQGATLGETPLSPSALPSEILFDIFTPPARARKNTKAGGDGDDDSIFDVSSSSGDEDEEEMEAAAQEYERDQLLDR